jgi:hypothetical protein
MQIGEEEEVIEIVPAEQPVKVPAEPVKEPVGVPA